MLQIVDRLRFKDVILDICEMPWNGLTEHEMIDAAWAYYYFSIQFRETLEIAASLYPSDPKLRQLVAEECDTANLSPFPGVAEPGEKMNHDTFMQRLLALSPIDDDKRARFEAAGQAYLDKVRSSDPVTRALSIASYEDGGLESVFRAILTAHNWNNPLLGAFRHFLVEHIRFDSDPEQGHGALSRHMSPDDRVLPIWSLFKQLFIDFVPALAG
jgi:hypothetical protein